MTKGRMVDMTEAKREMAEDYRQIEAAAARRLHPDNAAMAIACLQDDLAAKDGEISTLRSDNEQLRIRLAGALSEVVEWKIQAGKYSAGCELCAPLEVALRELLRVMETTGVGWGPAVDAARDVLLPIAEAWQMDEKRKWQEAVKRAALSGEKGTENGT